MMTEDDGEGSNALEICCACILDGVDWRSIYQIITKPLHSLIEYLLYVFAITAITQHSCRFQWDFEHRFLENLYPVK